ARGMGALLADDVRLADDPFGMAFAAPRIAKLVERGGLRALAALPGVKSWILYMQVRTRVLDDAVRAFIRVGGRQLVLLGAGYDCRALRLPELANAVTLEVDHPATQRHKRAVLERLGATSPARYVTWDFETRPMAELPAALVDAGLDTRRPTLTIWEGVTMYLTPGAIDTSLRAIHTWSSPGSQLAMTYFAKARLARPTLAPRAIQSVVTRLGEPWRWGWDPTELPTYLVERGFTFDRDIALSDAARELLPAHLARHVGDPDRRVALAASAESIALGSRA
nr:SAM-dependent methyltransferase [Deltaproteobacteria bacterium]